MVDLHPDAILAEVTRTVVERFAPERIVLFGSRARGDHHPESDYDLMIVADQSLSSKDVIVGTVRDICLSSGVGADVIVDSPERFERRRSDVGTLAYAADHEGRVLYARVPDSERRQVRETPSSPPESLKEWMSRAESDFTVLAALDATDLPAPHDAIVFHAHQGVEKLLKAAMVSVHVPPLRTHDLTTLVTRVSESLLDDSRLRDACAGLQQLWPMSRYPEQPVPTAEEATRAVAWAHEARAIVLRAIRH